MTSSSSSSLLLRLIHRNVFAGRPLSSSSSSSSSPIRFFKRDAHQMSSASQKPSPWLMLPPSSEAYKFYSIADDKVITVSKTESDLVPNGELKLTGSSHGWLALFNPRSLDLFLYNPLSRRQVKLPPIHNLPNYPQNNRRGANKVIVSCPPDDEQQPCSVLMSYNCIDALAFCDLHSGNEWTPIGDLFELDKNGKIMYARSYEDFVYSTRRKHFFCITNMGEVETWDLNDPSSPRIVPMKKPDDDKEAYVHPELEKDRPFCRTMEYVVELNSDILVVTRHIMDHMAPDGSYVDNFDEGSENYPYKTIDFVIQRYDHEVGDFTYMERDSLAGLALFIGFNHSMALSVAEFPELNPDSIYFTDAIPTTDLDNLSFGGHDIGIFNYRDKTLSSCYYPCDVRSIKRIVPSPVWFVPGSV